MSGKPGRSGIYKRTMRVDTRERIDLIIAYYVAGHSVRETALVFRVNKSFVGKIVKEHARSRSESAKLMNERRAASREAAPGDNG